MISFFETGFASMWNFFAEKKTEKVPVFVEFQFGRIFRSPEAHFIEFLFDQSVSLFYFIFPSIVKYEYSN